MIGVSVSGLSGSGLALSNNGSDTLMVSGNGSATFTKAVAAGGAYAVTVATQPASPSQTCTVANGTGTVGSANVTSVSVTCATNSYPVHATVSGLSGSGLVLQNNSGDDLAVAASGVTTFATQAPSGSSYNIAVLTQPTNPVQVCTVANGSGTVTSSAISAPAITCVTQMPWSVVTVNVGDGSISLFALDPATGQPRARGRYSAGLNAAPTDINGDGQGRFLYVMNSGTGNISGYQYDFTTSLLKPMTSGPFATGLSPNSLTGYPGSKTLYAVNSGSNDVYAYSIDQTTGALSLVASGPAKAGTNPRKLTLDAAGRFAYVTNTGSNDTYSYAVDATTGAITEIAGSRVSTGAVPFDLILHGTGKFAYVANTGSPDISAYTVNASTGVLTPMAGSPFANNGVPGDVTPFNGGREPMLLHPNGKLLFVRSTLSKTLSVFAIDPASGALSAAPGSPYGIGDGAVMQTLDPAGRFLFVANQGNSPGPGSISVFKVNVASGVLSEVSGSPFPLAGGPSFVSVDPSGEFVYASSYATNLLYGMKIDQTTGALKALDSGAAVLTGGRPIVALAIPAVSHPGKVVTFSSKVGYVVNSDDSISGYTIDATGKLSPTPTSPVQSNGAGVSALAVAPGGKHAYSANTTSSNVSVYDIDQTTGNLTPSTTTIGQIGIYAGPSLLSIDASGQTAFVVSNGDSTYSTIAAYLLDPTTGLFGNGSGVSFPPGQPPTAIAVEDSGCFVFGIRAGLLESYETYFPGSIATPGLNPPAVGPNAAALAVHPSGLFLYLANADASGTIQTFSVSSAAGVSAGTLSGGASTPTGSKPVSIAIEPTGHFLYAANSGSDNVSGFSIDQTSGALTALSSGPIAAGHHPISVTVDYSGKFLYVVSDVDKQVTTYTIDSTTGALQPATQAATGPAPKGLTISNHVTLQ
jgi:6-phosphogluconolactonase (cycloisomerase 2 family)